MAATPSAATSASITQEADERVHWRPGFNVDFGQFRPRSAFDGFNVNIPGHRYRCRSACRGVYHSAHDGYVRSTANPAIRLYDEDQSAIRTSVLFTPTPELEILVHGAYWERDDAGGGAYGYKTVGTLIVPATGVRSILGQPFAVNPSVRNGTNLINGISEGVSVTGDAYHVQWDYQPYERLREKYVSGQISYDLGAAVIKSITGYNDFRSNRSGDLDQSAVVFPAAGVASGFVGSGIQAPDTRDKSFSQELQLSSDDAGSPFQWIVGGYYFHDKVDELYSQVYTAPTAVSLGTRSRTKIDTKAYAAYGQATYAIVPDMLRLIGGVRYSDETKKYAITNFTAPVGTFDFNTQTAARATGEAKYNKVTWRGGVEFNATRDNMLYATVSTGFESGGINNNSSNALIPQAYAPQTVTAYEIGSKNRLAEGHVLVNLSAFYNDYKDLQITILDQVTNLSYYANAGAARAYGAELEVKTALYQGLHVDFTAALLDAQFTAYTRPNPFGNTTLVNLKGNDVPMSPTFKGTASVYYEADLGGHGTLTPHADFLYSSSYFATDYNTVLDRQKAYGIVDLSLRYTSAPGNYYLEGFVNNVGDYAVIYSATLGSTARVQNSFGPPRVWGLRLGAKF